MNTRFLSLAALMLVAPSLQAGELALADVADADRLIVTTWQSEIELAASDKEDVQVTYDCLSDEKANGGMTVDGLRRVGGGTRLPVLARNDEKITLKIGKEAGACKLRVLAPARLDAQLRVNHKGKVVARNWVGGLTTWVAEGDVDVASQTGPFSVTAMSGNASVGFTGKTLKADSAITAANGLLTLELGDTPAINLRAQARWGEIRSNLDAAFVNEAAGGQSWSTARLSGGGATVTLRNLNNDIVIRR